MIESWPVYTISGIITVALMLSAFIWLRVSQVLSSLDYGTLKKVSIRAGLGALFIGWFAVVLALTTSRVITPESDLSLALAISIPSALGLLLLRSATAREIIDAMPQHWLISFQTLRSIGLFFIILVDMALLPDFFGLPAGLGDVLVGLLAPLVAYWFYLKKPFARTFAFGLIALGLTDFVVALGLGVIVANPSDFDANIMVYVTLIPAFAVPQFFLMHIYSLRGLLRASSESRQANNYQTVALGAA